MRINHHWFVLAARTYIVAAVVAVAAVPAAAQAPWKKLNLFKESVEADPDKTYEVTEENGPWMIAAANFAGEHLEGRERAVEQAQALVQELRSKYRLTAYFYSKSFDYTDKVQGLTLDEWGKPKKLKYSRAYKGWEYAVLVGDYASVDDDQAQRDLERIKTIEPAALRPDGKGKSNQQLAWWRKNFKVGNLKKSQKEVRGPMGRAFVTTNPLLPEEFFVNRGVDKLVEQMNKGVEHCLLDCPGKYSVQVALFKGKVTIDKDKVASILERDAPPSNDLAEAAEKAHKVCDALREKGYEAYVYHDRGMSIVTVGSFDSVGTPRSDGKTEINPKIHKIMQVFGSSDTQLPGNLAYGQDMLRPVLTRMPKSIAGVQLDTQPLPVTVPKRSFAASVGAR